MRTTVTAALDALRIALATGNVIYRQHAADMIDMAGLTLGFVDRELLSLRPAKPSITTVAFAARSSPTAMSCLHRSWSARPASL